MSDNNPHRDPTQAELKELRQRVGELEEAETARKAREAKPVPMIIPTEKGRRAVKQWQRQESLQHRRLPVLRPLVGITVMFILIILLMQYTEFIK